jgi:hypothetical protein
MFYFVVFRSKRNPQVITDTYQVGGIKDCWTTAQKHVTELYNYSSNL